MEAPYLRRCRCTYTHAGAIKVGTKTKGTETLTTGGTNLHIFDAFLGQTLSYTCSIL